MSQSSPIIRPADEPVFPAQDQDTLAGFAAECLERLQSQSSLIASPVVPVFQGEDDHHSDCEDENLVAGDKSTSVSDVKMDKTDDVAMKATPVPARTPATTGGPTRTPEAPTKPENDKKDQKFIPTELLDQAVLKKAAGKNVRDWIKTIREDLIQLNRIERITERQRRFIQKRKNLLVSALLSLHSYAQSDILGHSELEDWVIALVKTGQAEAIPIEEHKAFLAYRHKMYMEMEKETGEEFTEETNEPKSKTGSVTPTLSPVGGGGRDPEDSPDKPANYGIPRRGLNTTKPRRLLSPIWEIFGADALYDRAAAPVEDLGDLGNV
eukprot:g17436.t1